MGINRTEQTIQDRLVNQVKEMQKQLRELKTSPQYIGGDIMQVAGTSIGASIAGPVTVASGDGITFVFTVTPANQTLTLWNFLHSIYIDSVLLDADYLYSGGASLTDAMKDMKMEAWIDWATSSDITNSRVYKVRIVNQDASTHTYMIATRGYLPLLRDTSTS